MASNGNSVKTSSELLFEEYLRSNEYSDFEFEPEIRGRRKHPDYLLRWHGGELLFEVKEREAPAQFPAQGHYYPYTGIRDEIDQARIKFQEFKDYCCNVVIANQGDPNTPLEAEFIFGAMLGDLGFTFPILQTNEDRRSETIQNVFLARGGKMVRYRTSEYQNTTIAAVIALEEARLRNSEFERLQRQVIHEEQRRRGRQLSPKEQAVLRWRFGTEYVEAGRGPIYRRAPRVIVCENPGARIPLPREVLCGPFDERWAIVDQRLSPVYAGVRVHEIEAPNVREDVCLRSNGRAG